MKAATTAPSNLQEPDAEIRGSASSSFGWWMALAGLAAVFLLGNYPLLSGRQALIWDAEDLFAPAYTLVADHARAGRLVLWDPWISAGAPDYAEPELGAASPVQVLAGALTGGTEAGFRLYFLLIWFLGPLGFLFLARHFRAAPWAAFVVAAGFAFCGFYTGHAQHVSSIYAFSFLPWVLWRFDVALVSRKWLPALQGGALWGLSALGGYPELVILTAGFLFVWAAGRCALKFPATTADSGVDPSHSQTIRAALCTLAIVAVVGTVVLLPSYFAFFVEGHGYSDRVGPRSRHEAVTSNTTPASAFLTFSSTYLTNLRMPKYHNDRLWPTSDVSLTNVYLGALIPILALFAIAYRPRSPVRWFLLVLTLFCCACAVGDQLPLRGWLYDYVFPTRYFRNPSLFREYGMFCVTLLALWATDDLRAIAGQSSERLWRHLTLTAGLLTAAAAIGYTYVVSLVSNRGEFYPRATRDSALIWISAFAVVLLCWLVPRARRLLPLMLVLLATGDAFLTIRLARPTMSTSGSTREVWTRINAAHDIRLDLTSGGLQRQVAPPAWIGAFANNENVPLRLATFFNYETMTNRFQVDFLNQPVLLGASTGADRIWFSPIAAQAPPTDKLYAAFVRRSSELGAPVIVVHARAEMPELRSADRAASNGGEQINAVEQLPPAQRIVPRVLRYTPNHLDLEVNCPVEGWLLVTDRWANGWRARVNGNPAELFGGDFIFRALRVRAGQNSVEFSYRPAGWPELLLLSWGVLAAVLVLTVPRLAAHLP
ncbi:MAG TPA: hypothetical protein VGR48_12780 [Terriglobales bacterium]|nr:hypothetical protein [Terriglobales bacterium]